MKLPIWLKHPQYLFVRKFLDRYADNVAGGLLGVPALISGIGAACASTAATVGAVAATTSAGGILVGFWATAGLGLLAKGAAAVVTKATAAKAAAGIADKCVAMSVDKEVGESVVKNAFCDKVRPVRGSILKVDLVGGLAEHTGVYLVNDRIAEVSEVDGRAEVRVVAHPLRDEFGVDYVSWRSSGCGTGDGTFA